MIASEVPVILEKACQSRGHSPLHDKLSNLTSSLYAVFISELTARAYIDSTKRRTLTKVDIAKATKQSDIFDFLIDVVPGETVEKKEKNKKTGGGGSASSKSRRQSDEEETQQEQQEGPNTLTNGSGGHDAQQQQCIVREATPDDEDAINDHLLNFDEANDVTLPADFSEGIFGLNGWNTQEN